jgi:hypothetical protein
MRIRDGVRKVGRALKTTGEVAAAVAAVTVYVAVAVAGVALAVLAASTAEGDLRLGRRESSGKWPVKGQVVSGGLPGSGKRR